MKGNTMRARVPLMCVLAMLVCAACQPGCMTAVKEGGGVARGAKGLYAPIKPLAISKDAKPLGEYRRFELRISSGLLHIDWFTP